MSNPPRSAKDDAVDPRDLRFTQESISDCFSKGGHKGVKLQDTINDLKASKLNPASFGQLWCEHNLRLYVLRQVGVPLVAVKIKHNDLKSRCLGQKERENNKIRSSHNTAP